MSNFFYGLLYVLIAIAILLAMIVIHELGHYVAGKLLKFKINEFSVGFGPKLFSRRSKKTGETFTLRLIPLGGYCAFENEEGLDEPEPESDSPPALEEVFPSEAPASVMPTPIEELRERNAEVEHVRGFTEEKPWKRVIVLLSGALFNFVSAIIFAFICIVTVGYAVPCVSELYADDAGNVYASELRLGDTIVAVNGESIGIMRTYEDMVENKQPGTKYTLTVERGGERIEVVAEVKRIVNTEMELDYMGLGFTPSNKAVRCGAGYAFTYCVPYACKLAWLVLGTLGGLITGRIPLTSVSGPVGTVRVMTQAGLADARNFLVLLPLIAANLAVFNILPIPALDGSKIVFTLIEWVRGKPVNRKAENIIHTVGMLLLFAFVIIIDIIGVFV